MKKLVLTLILALTLTGCINEFLGIDDQGNKVTSQAPADYVAAVLRGLGPIGIAAAGALGIGGSAYVAHKKERSKLTAVVAGVQKFRDSLDEEESNEIKKELAKHIPNKYHGTIKKIKDNL